MEVIQTVAPYFGLRTSQVWPISYDSAPFLISLWIAIVTTIYLKFFREEKNELFQEALEKRREDKMKTLKNIVLLEERRLGKPQKKDEKQKSADDVEFDFDEPPTAKYMFDIIFEEVEEGSISKVLDVPKMDPWFLRGVTLFKRRVQIELDEATTRTREAQTITLSDLHTSKEQQIIMDHQDGDKLFKVIEFIRLKAVKHFGDHLNLPGTTDGVTLENFDSTYLQNEKELRVVNKKSVKDAEKLLAEVRAAQRNQLWSIFDILKPVLPTYGLALLFMIFARAFEAPLWARGLPSFKSSVGTINPNATEGEFGFGPTVLKKAEGHAIFFIVGFLFSRPVEVLAGSFGDRAARDFAQPLRKAVMGAIMRQDTEYFDFNTSSKLKDQLNRDTDELVENLLWVPRSILENFFRVVQRSLTLYFVAPKMFWACVYFNVPLFSFIILVTQKPLWRLRGRSDRCQENTGAETSEILQNIKTVRQFSMEATEKKKYVLGNLTRGIFESRIRILETLCHNLRFVFHMIGEIYVIYVALNLAVSGEATPEDAVVCSTVGMWLQHDFKNLLETCPKIFKIMRPVARVASLLASQPRIEQDSNQKSDKLRPSAFRGNIEFKDVHFSYPTERQKQVLSGLSFTARSGQKVAFVGKAGCGKSTSMDLLQRFYNRSAGEILIDGHRIEEYDTNYLRRNFGVVAQNNVLFSRSIYENIVYGMDDPPGPESERFLEVCRKAEAWEFIQKFPNKQYTQIGEKGVKLSGGQKQRVAIARVIIREPTFLLLDEATSALDAINETSVQSALDEMLQKHSGVALVVAHRLTTICNCDKIVVLGDDGTVVEEGTHQELLKVPKQVDGNGKPVAGPGLYHSLWDIQQAEGTAQSAKLEKQLQQKNKEILRLQNELDWVRKFECSPTGRSRHLQRGKQRRSSSVPRNSETPDLHQDSEDDYALPGMLRSISDTTCTTYT